MTPNLSDIYDLRVYMPRDQMMQRRKWTGSSERQFECIREKGRGELINQLETEGCGARKATGSVERVGKTAASGSSWIDV